MKRTDWSSGRLYIQYISPSAKKFFVLSTERVDRFMSASALAVSLRDADAVDLEPVPASRLRAGSSSSPASFRFLSVKASSLTMMIAAVAEQLAGW